MIIHIRKRPHHHTRHYGNGKTSNVNPEVPIPLKKAKGWSGVAFQRTSAKPPTYINYLTRKVGKTRASVLQGGKFIRYAKPRKLL